MEIQELDDCFYSWSELDELCWNPKTKKFKPWHEQQKIREMLVKRNIEMRKKNKNVVVKCFMEIEVVEVCVHVKLVEVESLARSDVLSDKENTKKRKKKKKKKNSPGREKSVDKDDRLLNEAIKENEKLLEREEARRKEEMARKKKTKTLEKTKTPENLEPQPPPQQPTIQVKTKKIVGDDEYKRFLLQLNPSGPNLSGKSGGSAKSSESNPRNSNNNFGNKNCPTDVDLSNWVYNGILKHAPADFLQELISTTLKSGDAIAQIIKAKLSEKRVWTREENDQVWIKISRCVYQQYHEEVHVSKFDHCVGYYEQVLMSYIKDVYLSCIVDLHRKKVFKRFKPEHDPLLMMIVQKEVTDVFPSIDVILPARQMIHAGLIPSSCLEFNPFSRNGQEGGGKDNPFAPVKTDSSDETTPSALSKLPNYGKLIAFGLFYSFSWRYNLFFGFYERTGIDDVFYFSVIFDRQDAKIDRILDATGKFLDSTKIPNLTEVTYFDHDGKKNDCEVKVLD